MIQIFGNNAGSKLAAPITNSQTALTVTAGDGAKFPSPAAGQYFTLTAVDQGSGLIIEIMWCTAVSGDTLTVQRAKEGTTAHAYAFGDPVANLWTAGSAANLAQNPSDKLGATSAVQTYAGNPNGSVAGNAAVVGASAPSLVWDTANQIFWTCVTTGTTSTAVWIAATNPGQTNYGGTAGGSANALTVTPAIPLALSAGAAISFIVSATNTGAATANVSGTGAIAIRKKSRTGPAALIGNEMAVGSLATLRYDGTFWQLEVQTWGTAALADASSNTGKVSAVVGSGTLTVGHLAVFADTAGSVQDGGLPNAASAATYLNFANANGSTQGPGVYNADTSPSAGGSFSVLLPAAPGLGASLVFMDNTGYWSINPLTVQRNGNTILGIAEDAICDVRGLVIEFVWNGSDWRLV